jgi:type I restriction enzyme S subunit
MKQQAIELPQKEEKQPLPPGWRWVRLGEVCDVVNGFGFAEHFQGKQDLPFPFIKVSDMNTEGAETIIHKAVNTVDDQILKSLRARTYPAGTVIFPKVGGALLTNKKRLLGVEATFDNNIMGLVPKAVDSRWLFHWMQTIDLRGLSNIQALPSIRQSVVASLRVPMPPLSEQRRIAVLLNEQMAAVQQARAATEAQLEAAKALPAAYLRAIFDNPEAKKWRLKSIKEICDAKRGITYGIIQTGENLSEGVPVVRGGDIRNYKVAISNLKHVSEELSIQYERTILQGNELLLAIRGSVGSVAEADKELVGANASREVAVIPLLQGINRKYVMFALSSPLIQSSIFVKITGAAQRGINLSDVAEIQIPYPDLERQQLIVETLLTLIEDEERVQRVLIEQFDAINALPAALLRRAFNGEL